MFVFRYQYLLIEVGTTVLRKVFDYRVSNDFMRYLNANQPEYKQLNYLINKGIISTTQKAFLPSLDTKPSSSNFDITLLVLLLRHVCGLSPRGDDVWTKPVPGDTSTEADIARLRICRNNLQHQGTVFISEADFKTRWNELCQILVRLNKVAGLPDLQSDINKAEHIPLDEQLEEQLKNVWKAWAESDRLLEQRLDELESDVTTVKQDLVGVASDVTTVKQDLVGVASDVDIIKQDVVRVKRKFEHVEHNDIQQDLIETYKRRCSALPVSPLFDNKDENILQIYKRNAMQSVEGIKNPKKVSSLEEIFCKSGKQCKHVYITGDAGLGKTSFCTFMCSLWSLGKRGDKLVDKHKELQKDVDYISTFDLVFYISLRDTECYDVIDMIKEQYLRDHGRLTIRDILRTQRCLIIMDGLDEWQPKQAGKKKHKLPEKFDSENCVYITTSRPYRLESVRLSRRDVDHYVQTTGIDKDAARSYVTDVIQYMNEENCTLRSVSEFMKTIRECELDDQLCIPMVASHLVMIWFENKLMVMPRSIIYANILEMLFRRGKKKCVEFPPSTASASLQLPDALKGLEFVNQYASLLYNVCHLSFRALFKQGETNLVFTRQQLLSAPYSFSMEEMNFMCAIGIFSKHEVFGCYSEEKLKVSFIHKSYVEFFAALFITSFDRSNSFSDVIQSWKTLDDVFQFDHFFLLLAGLSYNKVKSAIENVYLELSQDIATQRRNSIFYRNQDVDNYSLFHAGNAFCLLQKLVIKCYKEVSRSAAVTNIELKLEDFIFDTDGFLYDSRTQSVILEQLLHLNRYCVYSLRTTSGGFLDEFSQIENVQCIHVGRISNFDEGYDERFSDLMVKNKSTLHTLCIERVGMFIDPISDDGQLQLCPCTTDGEYTLVPKLPLRSLHHLTSLSLSCVAMQHAVLRDLVRFLSENTRIENVKLNDVACDYHTPCSMILNLQNHTKLTSIYLTDVDIVCHNVNTSSLKYITMRPPLLSQRNNSSYFDVLTCVKDSHLEHLEMYSHSLDDKTMRMMTAVLNSLPCIKCLILRFVEFPDDVLLCLHPGTTQIEIELHHVTMNRRCFHSFIDSLVKKSVMKVKLSDCTIKLNDGETHRKLTPNESACYMQNYIGEKMMQTVSITLKTESEFDFQTKSSQ